MVSTNSSSGQIAVGGAQSFTLSCDAGRKVVGGDFSSDKLVVGFDSYPSNHETTWSFFLGNLDDSGAANVSTYATCIR